MFDGFCATGCRFVAAMRAEVNIPVTVKTRIGIDDLIPMSFV